MVSVRLWFCTKLALRPVFIRVLQGDVARVTACRAEGIRADLNKVVDSVSLASEPYSVLDDLVLLFLLGEGTLDVCYSLSPFLNHLCHRCWRQEPSQGPGELDIVAAVEDLVWYQFHTSLLAILADVNTVDP